MVEGYLEQSVSGEKTPRRAVAYALCWVLIALLVMIAMMFGANVFADESDALRINWLNLVLLILLLASAFFVFRRKDCLRMEYDYIYHGNALEICGIFNSRRRKKQALIPVERIIRCGSAMDADGRSAIAQPGLRKHNWYVHRDAPLFYIIYIEDNVRHIALLELDAAMRDALKRSQRLQSGAWRNEEGKN